MLLRYHVIRGRSFAICICDIGNYLGILNAVRKIRRALGFPAWNSGVNRTKDSYLSTGHCIVKDEGVTTIMAKNKVQHCV